MTRLFLLSLLFVGCAHTPAAAAVTQCGNDVCALSKPPAAKVEPRHIHLGAIKTPDIVPFAVDLREAINANEEEIIVDIDSPGGSVSVGLAIIALLNEAQAQGTSITCRVDGMAASMAAIVLAAGCDKRTMTVKSSIMYHEPSISDIDGKEWELRRWADRLADTNKRMAILVAPHLKHLDGTRWTASEYMAWVADRDRWVSCDEALEMGAVDGCVQ